MDTINYLNQVSNFLDQLYNEVESVGIDVSNLNIDHIAYTTSSSEEYDKVLPLFLSEGTMVKESMISERRVAMIKLNFPILYRQNKIEVVELIEPTKDEPKNSEWEHAEFLIDNYDNFIAKYPNLDWNIKHKDKEFFSRIKLTLPSGKEVKFLDMPVLEAAKLEGW